MNALFRAEALAILCLIATGPAFAESKPQYQAGDLIVPQARADEPKRAVFSAALADAYLQRGAVAWARSRRCVSCHTTGTYLAIRPALTAELGPPDQEVRDLFIANLRAIERRDHGHSVKGGIPVYIASGLAEWDAHVCKRLQPETSEALTLMLNNQLEDGSWNNATCWPPLESDNFQLATQAAIAIATAPEWLAHVADPRQLAQVATLKQYLRQATPPHDYDQTVLLWAAARMPDLLSEERKRQIMDMIWRHQMPDGGWSIRSFAAPEAWGKGARAGKLRAEEDFSHPASDGHQTGLAIIVLRESGVPAADPRLQRGIHWLTTNQRVSGRWWTRSLNTDHFHYITYSGTAYPLLALSLCGLVAPSPSPHPSHEIASIQ